MEQDIITIRYDPDYIEMQSPVELENLINICRAKFNISLSGSDIIILSYFLNKLKIVEIRTQQDLEQAIRFFKDNKKTIDLKLTKTENPFRNGIPIVSVPKLQEAAVSSLKTNVIQELKYSKPKTETIKIDCKQYLDSPNRKSKSFQEFEEINSFKDLKGPIFIFNNQRVNLAKLRKQHKNLERFTVTSNPNAVNILRCKEENNEKLKIFKVIIGKVTCFCGGVVKDRFWLCACCKMWYRCANCGEENDETHKVVEYIIDETKKLEKLKKNIMKLGFDNEKQVEKAIYDSQFYYSGAVGLLFKQF